MKGPARFAFALACGLLINAAALARVIVQSYADPSRSRHGESVTFKVIVEHEDTEPVTPPRTPVFADWDVVNSWHNEATTNILSGGRPIFKQKVEFSYVLRPLRKGQLKIPSLSLQVGSTPYKTEAIFVTVDNPAGGGTMAQPHLQPQQNGPPQGNPYGAQPLPQLDDDDNNGDLLDPFGQPLPHAQTPPPPPPSNVAPPNTRESFFIRADSTSTDVYQGQLIVLSYNLYIRDTGVGLANPEIRKFPDFKGFLKEELVVPKSLTRTPVEINGQTYFRSELIRYAVFPLKSGKLTIEPMQFKADMQMSQADMMNNMMRNMLNGQMPDPNAMRGFQAIPMTKSSQILNVNARSLPPATGEIKFTGGVGEFKMDVSGPQGKLQVDQPFTVTLTIAGKGNIKAIEEPPMTLPKTLEPFQTKNNYEFREDATGYKTFEYLILPRQAGKVTIDPIKWTYFDPAKGQYVNLAGPPLELSIEGSNAPVVANNKEEAKKEEWRFAPVRSGPQRWLSTATISRKATPAALALLAAQTLLYAFASLTVFRRRNSAESEAHFRRYPWERTARQIRSKAHLPAAQLAILIDEWTRERLTGYIRERDESSSIHAESARDDFIEALRSILHAEEQRGLEPLRRLWSDLDILRFTGAGEGAEKAQASPDELFERAQRTVGQIIKGGVIGGGAQA